MSEGFVFESGLISTRQNSEYTGSEAGLATACGHGKILEATAVMCDPEMNLYVDLGGIRGIIPRSEALWSADGNFRDIAVITRVGKPVCFKVTELTVKDGVKTAMLSRRAAQQDCIEGFLSYLRPGDIIPCRVTHTDSFGAFVDCGCGVSALLPVDCISVSRIGHSSERLKVGQILRCAVKSVSYDPFRIFVTLRELLGTWSENAERFEPGQTVSGVVRGIEDYGIFIELMPNLAGLAEYRPGLYEGQGVTVYIKSMDSRKMKVKLVIVSESSPRQQMPVQYFIGSDIFHIYRWEYSTPQSGKDIFTDFEN